jgi:hypothetical protein
MDRIVKPIACLLLGLGFAGALALPAKASVVVVTPTSMGSWAFANMDGNNIVGANPTGSGGMVVGPATPPIGIGSANLATGNGTIGGDGSENLSTTGYSGTQLSSLTTLTYSTYDTVNNTQQFPVLEIEIATGLAGSDAYDQLFFEPPYQTPTTGNPSLPNQGATALDTWQSWNVLSGGLWDNQGIAGCGSPGSGVASLSSCISAIETLGGDPTIVNTRGPGSLENVGLGGLIFFVGETNPTDQFNGNVDDFTIGVSGSDTTYDFDPTAVSGVPEPATWAMMLIGFGLVGLQLKRRNTARSFSA